MKPLFVVFALLCSLILTYASVLPVRAEAISSSDNNNNVPDTESSPTCHDECCGYSKYNCINVHQLVKTCRWTDHQVLEVCTKGSKCIEAVPGKGRCVSMGPEYRNSSTDLPTQDTPQVALGASICPGQYFSGVCKEGSYETCTPAPFIIKSLMVQQYTQCIFFEETDCKTAFTPPHYEGNRKEAKVIQEVGYRIISFKCQAAPVDPANDHSVRTEVEVGADKDHPWIDQDLVLTVCSGATPFEEGTCYGGTFNRCFKPPLKYVNSLVLKAGYSCVFYKHDDCPSQNSDNEIHVEIAKDKQLWVSNFNLDIGSMACRKEESINSEENGKVDTGLEARADKDHPWIDQDLVLTVCSGKNFEDGTCYGGNFMKSCFKTPMRNINSLVIKRGYHCVFWDYNNCPTGLYKIEDHVEDAKDQQLWVSNLNLDIGSLHCTKKSTNGDGNVQVRHEIEVRADKDHPWIDEDLALNVCTGTNFEDGTCYGGNFGRCFNTPIKHIGSMVQKAGYKCTFWGDADCPMGLPPIDIKEHAENTANEQLWISNLNLDMGSLACRKVSTNSEGNELEVHADKTHPWIDQDLLLNICTGNNFEEGTCYGGNFDRCFKAPISHVGSVIVKPNVECALWFVDGCPGKFFLHPERVQVEVTEKQQHWVSNLNLEIKSIRCVKRPAHLTDDWPPMEYTIPEGTNLTSAVEKRDSTLVEAATANIPDDSTLDPILLNCEGRNLEPETCEKIGYRKCQRSKHNVIGSMTLKKGYSCAFWNVDGCESDPYKGEDYRPKYYYAEKTTISIYNLNLPARSIFCFWGKSDLTDPANSTDINSTTAITERSLQPDLLPRDKTAAELLGAPEQGHAIVCTGTRLDDNCFVPDADYKCQNIAQPRIRSMVIDRGYFCRLYNFNDCPISSSEFVVKGSMTKNVVLEGLGVDVNSMYCYAQGAESAAKLARGIDSGPQFTRFCEGQGLLGKCLEPKSDWKCNEIDGWGIHSYVIERGIACEIFRRPHCSGNSRIDGSKYDNFLDYSTNESIKSLRCKSLPGVPNVADDATASLLPRVAKENNPPFYTPHPPKSNSLSGPDNNPTFYTPKPSKPTVSSGPDNNPPSWKPPPPKYLEPPPPTVDDVDEIYAGDAVRPRAPQDNNPTYYTPLPPKSTLQSGPDNNPTFYTPRPPKPASSTRTDSNPPSWTPPPPNSVKPPPPSFNEVNEARADNVVVAQNPESTNPAFYTPNPPKPSNTVFPSYAPNPPSWIPPRPEFAKPVPRSVNAARLQGSHSLLKRDDHDNLAICTGYTFAEKCKQKAFTTCTESPFDKIGSIMIKAGVGCTFWEKPGCNPKANPHQEGNKDKRTIIHKVDYPIESFKCKSLWSSAEVEGVEANEAQAQDDTSIPTSPVSEVEMTDDSDNLAICDGPNLSEHCRQEAFETCTPNPFKIRSLMVKPGFQCLFWEKEGCPPLEAPHYEGSQGKRAVLPKVPYEIKSLKCRIAPV